MVSRRRKLEKTCCYRSTAKKSYFFIFSYQAIVGRGDSGNILLPGVTTLSSFPILEQTNIVLVTLLSFERDLMKNTILCPLSETDRYGKILSQNRKLKKEIMQVLFIMRLSTNGFWTVLRRKFVPLRYWGQNVSAINLLFNILKLIFVSFKYSTSTDIYMLYPSKWKRVG